LKILEIPVTMYKKVAIENPMSMGGFTGGVRGGGG
jgi:hypothetical protein